MTEVYWEKGIIIADSRLGCVHQAKLPEDLATLSYTIKERRKYIMVRCLGQKFVIIL